MTRAKLNQVKASKNKKFLVLEIIKEHTYGVNELKTVEYIFFKN